MPRIRRIRRRKVNRAADRADRMEAEVAAILPSRFKNQSKAGVSRIAIAGPLVFSAPMKKLLAEEPELDIVAVANTYKDAFAIVNEFGAELVIVDADFGGNSEGILLAREMNDRTPGCAFMLITGGFNSSTAKNLWIHGADSWSVISNATAQNPHNVAEAVSSAVHGIAWVEPGIQREMKKLGPRPRSLAVRRVNGVDDAQSA